jgi:GMP synthase (glutamine-hydrolysing)
MTKKETILVLDFGSQYTQLIARRIRELNVYSEIVPYTIGPDEIKVRRAKGLILSGGPASVYEPGALHSDPSLLHLGLPVLGICYGMQLITQQMGGQVQSAERREYGPATIEVLDDPLFRQMGTRLDVWMSHGDRIQKPADGFISIASTDSSPVAAVRNSEGTVYGLQFHPEVAHTPRGTEILRNFVFEICGCAPSWTPASFIEETDRMVGEKVRNGKILCALSGGVDSSVMAFLLRRAAGDSLIPIFIDNGLLRRNEGEQVTRRLQQAGIDVRYYDASDCFLSRLENVEHPEDKRKIIGRAFVEVFEGMAAEIPGLRYLAQGAVDGAARRRSSRRTTTWWTSSRR